MCRRGGQWAGYQGIRSCRHPELRFCCLMPVCPPGAYTGGRRVVVSEPAVPLDVDGVLLDRAATVADAVHSAQMEGLSVSPDTRRDMDAYSAGSIDLAELLRRTKARHGVS